MVSQLLNGKYRDDVWARIVVHRIGNAIILPNEILFYLVAYAIANDSGIFSRKFISRDETVKSNETV